VPLIEVVRRYAEAGTDFLAVTDHDHVTDLHEVRRVQGEMLLLQGFEHSSTQHTLFVGQKVRPLYRRSLGRALSRANGLITVIAHPAPRKDCEYHGSQIIASVGGVPTGIEVHNGHYGIPAALEQGKVPRYTHIWDELLSMGHRIWGFAGDDFHDHEDFSNAFLMVRARDRTTAAILDSLRHGRFYASTGLTAREVHGVGGRLDIETAVECRGHFIGPGGATLSESTGTSFSFEASDQRYVRFQAEADTGTLFMQPVFREVEEPIA